MRSTSHRSLRRNRSNIHGQRRGREMNLQVALERHIDRTSAPTRVDRDHDLLEALGRHEPMAAERLVSTYGERAYRLASRMTGNREDAQEVVQDAFWTVIRKIDMFRGESAFGSWLYRIRSEEHTSELQSLRHLVCRLLLEKKKVRPVRGHHVDRMAGLLHGNTTPN